MTGGSGFPAGTAHATRQWQSWKVRRM